MVGRPVRVRGSAHSIPEIYQTDARQRGRPDQGIDVLLDRLSFVQVDREHARVRAGGGARFGYDRRDPTGRSVPSNGIIAALESAGLALPLLGGVTHQTVAGFFATGSSGGSVQHNLLDSVLSLRLVDGTGRIRTFERDRDPEFFGVVVSLGLLGIVTEVTLACTPSFSLAGTERTMRRGRGDLELTSSEQDGLQHLLVNEPYARVLWWPQPGVDKLVVWTARPADVKTPIPYHPFPPTLGSRTLTQAMAGRVLASIGHRPEAIDRLGRNPALRPAAWLGNRLVGQVYEAFLPEGTQRFADRWHRAIPVDDQIVEHLFPTRFLEIWLPLEQTPEVMRRLERFYRSRGYAATENFAVEIYASKADEFWLSPGYGRDSLRLNFFWLERDHRDPRHTYFPRFIDLFEDLAPRYHWGKDLGPNPKEMGRRLSARYPHWTDFLQLRRDFDPDGLFSNDYLRDVFNLHDETKERAETSGPPPSSPRPFRFPIAFELEPTSPNYAAEAESCLTAAATCAAPADRILALFAAQEHGRPEDWTPECLASRHLSWEPDGVGTVVDESFWFMSLRFRTVLYDPGRRWVASVDRVSHPLMTRMMQEVRTRPRPNGGCEVRFQVHYDPVPALRSVEPVLRLFFQAFVERTLRRATHHANRSR